MRGTRDKAHHTGWPSFEENWFKIPNCVIDYIADVHSLAELKVILYVFRHTQGYQETGKFKKITTDEFQNGRKRRDGTRIDRGVNLSVPSIISGLRKAVAHGHIVEKVEGEDKARIKKYYALRMTSSRSKESLPPLSTKFRVALKKVKSNSKESLERSEKDNKRKIIKERKYKKDNINNIRGPVQMNTSSSSSKLKEQDTPNQRHVPSHSYFKRCAERLNSILSLNSPKSDYVDQLHEGQSNRGPSYKKDPQHWVKTLYLLHKKDLRGDTKTFSRTLDWFSRHANGVRQPVVFTAKDYRQAFPQLLESMLQCQKQKKRNGGIELSERALRIADRAETHIPGKWPKNSGKAMPLLIERALRKYREFMRDMNSIQESSQFNEKTKRVAKLVCELLPPHYVFVESFWLEWLYKQIANWDAWNGNLRMFEFLTTSGYFVDQCKKALGGYGRNADSDWELLTQARTKNSCKSTGRALGRTSVGC